MKSTEYPINKILINKLLETGLYDQDRAEELVGRIDQNEKAMLEIIGRLAVEEQRGGSKVQQCIRALVKTDAIPSSLETFEKLMGHELADPTFPVK